MAEVSAQIGAANNAQRITVNLSAEIGDALRSIAIRCHVSESSIVEIAIRQLLRQVGSASLEAYLRERGGCLRRRRR